MCSCQKNLQEIAETARLLNGIKEAKRLADNAARGIFQRGDFIYHGDYIKNELKQKHGQGIMD